MKRLFPYPIGPVTTITQRSSGKGLAISSGILFLFAAVWRLAQDLCQGLED
jgi:hypothetical protein